MLNAKVLGMQDMSDEYQQELGRTWLLALYLLNMPVDGIRIEFTSEPERLPEPVSEARDLIKRAHAAMEGITPGPWIASGECDGVRAGRDTVVRAVVPESLLPNQRVVTVDQTRPHWDSERFGKAEANVAFIAAARSLVPELVAALAKLTAHYPVEDGEGFFCSCSTPDNIVSYDNEHVAEVNMTE